MGRRRDTPSQEAGAHNADVDLVLFDLDGVLVDTQDAENAAIAYLASLMGLPISQPDATLLFSGKRLRTCIDLLEEMASRSAPADAARLVRDKCDELIGSALDPIDGVAEVLRTIDIDKCVVSNSPRHIIERRLRAAGILRHFGGRLYSAYEVNAWKPDPRLFKWAALECGAGPDKCVVIEDSSVGVTAALAAGMKVLQFNVDASVGPHAAGVRTFNSMRMLPALIGIPASVS